MKKAIELLYRDYYLNDVSAKDKIKHIYCDKQLFYIFSKLNKLKDFDNFDNFIVHYTKKFTDQNTNLIFSEKKDSIGIEKMVGSLSYPFILNIDRIKILEEAIIDKDDEKKIFGMALKEIYIITSAIILRTLLYNDYISRKKMTTQERKNVFNTIHPTCLFKSTDLNIMIEDIKEETIQKYLDIFSININQISSSEDTKKIIEYDNEYVFPFLNEFCTFLFNDCEKRIIDYYKNNNKHEKYYLARGKAFEKYVNNILKNMYSDVKTNVNYIDNENRKMELDNLIITDELCLNFECKSSGFNVYNYDSDKETIQNMKSAFGRGYLSVNTFHNTVKMNNGIIEFFDGKFKKNYNLNNHKIVSFNVTMYPIEFLSTCIHYFDEKLSNSIQFFPITINVMDLYCIFILGIYNKKLVEYYIIERFNSINKMHKFKIDNDEINAFGYITDFNLKNGYSFMKEINNDIAELNISISNNLYREEINSVMANYGFRLLIDTIFKEELKNIVIKIISKE